VTRSLRIGDHQVEDWRPAALPMAGRAAGFGLTAFPQRGGFGAAPTFPHQGFGAQALSVPSVVYLVTSSRPDFAAYITDDPMGRPRPRPTGSTSWCFSCRSG
jgi:acyl CoA:acetate/3-ketoacid CoA transferase alpha subunit